MIKDDVMHGGVHLPELVERLKMAVVNRGADYESALVGIKDVNRPGLQLAGYFDYFDERRLQVIGMAETKMLESMTSEQRSESFAKLFSYNIPALVVSRDLDIYPECLTMARKYQRTLLHTAETTVDFTTKVIELLTQLMAPTITRHGVLLDIYGEGVLITGDSGIGKSETAIELVKRGHRLVADDAVELRKVSSRKIMGMAPANIRHFIELRGIGIINVARLFGAGAVKNSVEVEMVVELEPWERTKNYDRTGLEMDSYDILGVAVPSMLIPVMPGRNLAVILETAAINNRQKEMGYNAAQELLNTLGLQNDIGSGL